jgi:hypothetical protein
MKLSQSGGGLTPKGFVPPASIGGFHICFRNLTVVYHESRDDYNCHHTWIDSD